MDGTLREYAAHRRAKGDKGCSRQAVELAIASARLPAAVVQAGPPKRIADFEAADRAWEENTRQRVDDQSQARGRAPGPASPNTPGTYVDERALKEFYAREKLRLHVEEKEGRLSPIEAQVAVVEHLAELMRRKLLDVADRVCRSVAAKARAAATLEEAEVQVRAAIDAEHRLALQELSDAEGPSD